MSQTLSPLIPPPRFHEACRTLGLELSAPELEQYGRYLAMMLATNEQFNLTAIREPEAAWMRHVLESLSLMPHVGEAKRVADVGSGGGVPGIPLAIAMPDRSFTLFEATGKKARFLVDVVKELALANVRVVNDRSETAGQSKEHRETYEVVTARAVGVMRVLAEMAMPLVRVGGAMLAMKGKAAEAEINEAAGALATLGAGEVEVYEALPGMNDEAVIVRVAKAKPTPRPYPRPAGQAKARPL